MDYFPYILFIYKTNTGEILLLFLIDESIIGGFVFVVDSVRYPRILEQCLATYDSSGICKRGNE